MSQDAGKPAGQAQVAPYAGLYYYVINNNKPPFDNPDVRKASSMSINREVIGPQILGTVVFYMVLIVVLNLIVDILYAWLDPRVRSR